MKKVAFITASPATVTAFLSGYIDKFSQEYEVHIITTLNNESSIHNIPASIQLHDVNIYRAPHLWADIKSVWQLTSLFKREKFDVVHSVTPKAGLLTQISATISRVSHRFHTFTGQVWVTKKGIPRYLLKYLDKLTATLATFTLIDSPSQHAFLIKEKVVTSTNSLVLGQGSISGVNIEKYKFSADTRAKLRALHGVEENEFVFLFVGRLNKEKGVPELIEAYKCINPKFKAKLFILGTDEGNLVDTFSELSNVYYLGFKTNVSDYYSFADVLTLPSHREGFGNVIIEAASCNLPSIASNIYGLSDAVAHKKTGLLHDVKSVDSIKQQFEYVLSSPQMLKEMRYQARKRVESCFDEAIFINALSAFYKRFNI